MKRLSKNHKVADSYTDGNAWVRKFLDESELASDIRVTQILDSDASEEEKMKYIASRATELLQEGGYEGYRIQNVSGDDIKIDHEQIYKLVVQHNELKEESSKRSKVTKKADTFWPALGGSEIKHEDHVDVYQGHDTKDKSKLYECPKGSNKHRWEKPTTKRAYPEDKWQSQKEVVPIGFGEKGWAAYEPYKKSDSGPQKSVLRNTDLKQAVDQLMVNKDPKYIDEVKSKLIAFIDESGIKDTDKRTIIQNVNQMRNPFDLMKYYYYSISKYEIGSTDTEVESGFFDSPVDLGKRPKGDFPSVQWMPRGQEDLDVRDDDYLTNRGDNHVIPKCDREAGAQPIDLTAEDTADGKDTSPQLTNKMMTDMIPMLIEEGEPTNHTCGNCNMRYTDKDGVQRCTVVEGKISYDKGTCNFMAAGDEAKEEDSVDHKMTYDTAGYVETDFEVNCGSCMYYTAEKEHCNLWMGTIKPEGCCMAWDRTDVTVPEENMQGAVVKWMLKTSDENGIIDSHEKEIAAKYGPEYNTALMHAQDAIKNGHSNDRALEYAVAEMQKVEAPVSPEILSEVMQVYLSV